MHASLLQRADDAVDHAVLLRAMWRDELLLQTAAAHQARVVAAGDTKAIVRAQQEDSVHSSKSDGSIALFQCSVATSNPRASLVQAMTAVG
jgi:hypothetical protein